MAGYYAHIQFGTHAPCISPFPHVDAAANSYCSAAAKSLRRSSLKEGRKKKKNREQPLLLSCCQPSRGDHLLTKFNH